MKPNQFLKSILFSPCLLLLLLSFSYTNSKAQCSEGINQTFAILNFGSGNTYYNLQSTSGNPNFEDANLGSFCPSGTLILEGGQNQVYKCSGADIWQNQIWYRIYLTSASPTGAFTPITEYYQSGYSNGCGGADQTWEANGANINVLSGLSAGTYYLEVYSTADYQYCGSGTIYASNNSYNYRATFTVNATPSLTVNSPRICAGSTATLTATGGSSYVWNNDSTTSSITTATAGAYTVTATNSSGCTASASGTVVVNPNPTAYAGDDTFVDFVTNVVLGDSTPIGGIAPYTFAWTPGKGLSDSTTQFPVCTPLATTKYYLTVTDSNGCKNTDSVIVAFNKGNNALTDIKYSAQNLAFTDSGQYLEFDLYASDTPANLLFSQGQVFLTYDTLYFGAALISSGAITVTKGQAIDSPYYNLVASDSTRNMIKLSITHTANPTSLANLDSISQQLCHFKFRVASVGTPFVTFDSILMVGQSLYQRTPTSLEFPYDLVQVQGLVGTLRGDDISFQLAGETLTATQLSFDLQAEATGGDFFYSSDITISYSTDNFGTYIQGGGHLSCTSSLDNSLYTFSYPDNNSNSFTISFSGSYDVTTGANPPTLDGSYTTIATCTVDIQNCCKPATGDYLDITNVSNAYYAYVQSVYDPIDSIYVDEQETDGYSVGASSGNYNNGNSSLCGAVTPTINSVDPMTITAGTFSILTINGIGFGCNPGSVMFPNADNGGTSWISTQDSDLVLWTDSKIEVYVPSTDNTGGSNPAGSGDVKVVTSAGTVIDAMINLDIQYAILNLREANSQPIIVFLEDQNGSGGITFHPRTVDTSGVNTDATWAISQWDCATGVNFHMDTAVSNGWAQDGVNVVMLTNPAALNPGDVAQTKLYTDPECSVTNAGVSHPVVGVSEIDMRVSNVPDATYPTVAWSYATNSDTGSFATVVLHEFGHAGGLQHAMPFPKVMYYTTPGFPFDSNLTLKYEDIIGGELEVGNITVNNHCSSIDVQTFPGGCTATNGINNVSQDNITISVSPVPTTETVTVDISTAQSAVVTYELIDVLGQVISANQIHAIEGTTKQVVSLEGLSNGVYLLVLQSEGRTQTFKLVKQ
jgi:hypothetical protein